MQWRTGGHAIVGYRFWSTRRFPKKVPRSSSVSYTHLDSLRENDWLPRSLRRSCRLIEAAITQLEQETGRAPSEKELADSLGMTLADYQTMLQDARGHQLVYLEDLVSCLLYTSRCV